MGSCSISASLDPGLFFGFFTCGSTNVSAGGFAGRRISSTWTDKPIILTIVSAYASRLEKQSMQPGSSFFRISSIDVIQIATFGSRCLQAIGKFRLASPLFSQVRNAKLFKAFSHARVWLTIVCGPLVRFAASNFWRSLKSRRLEYFVVCAYIILSFVITSYTSKSETWPVSVQLYIQLS